MKKILIVDDDRDIRFLLSRFLTKKGYQVVEVGDVKGGMKQIEDQKFDLVITDFKLPDGDGLEMSRRILVKAPSIPIIMITAYSDVKVAVKAVKRGIYDYITKPLHPDDLIETIERALDKKAEEDSVTEVSKDIVPNNSKPKSKSNSGQYIFGESAASDEVKKHISLIAPTDMSVVILGETGSGKEYAAKEIHHQSNRASQPFVAVDCGALSDEIAGSELFGHVKGAFTGAISDKVGCFEYANGGTIFLDEIGNLSMQHQVKLLRVLQESKVKKLGSNKETPFDVRVIVATNDDLEDKITSDEFRQDLWYRLNEFSLKLPPLRERKDDIPIFANHFLMQASKNLGRDVNKIDKKALSHMQNYPWNGNLRELRNVIKRGVLMSNGDTLTSEVLPGEIKMPSTYFLQQTVDENDLKSASLGAEEKMIKEALIKTGNNKSKAAELLNIDRKTLYNKLKQFEL